MTCPYCKQEEGHAVNCWGPLEEWLRDVHSVWPTTIEHQRRKEAADALEDYNQLCRDWEYAQETIAALRARLENSEAALNNTLKRERELGQEIGALRAELNGTKQSLDAIRESNEIIRAENEAQKQALADQLTARKHNEALEKTKAARDEMKYPAFASDTKEANYVRTPMAAVRWLIVDGKAELQQLYQDGWGHDHWVTVPSVLATATKEPPQP